MCENLHGLKLSAEILQTLNYVENFFFFPIKTPSFSLQRIAQFNTYQNTKQTFPSQTIRIQMRIMNFQNGERQR